MTPKRRLRYLSVLVGVLTLLVTSWWYQWSARPLTQAEVNGYMARIEAQTQVPGGRHNLPALREFLETDDGRPFFTVNLFKFFDRARYAQGASPGGSGRDAFDRFARVMISLQARRASNVVFATDWVGKANFGNYGDGDAGNEWDHIVIVRYRSRKDLAEIFATEEFADAAAHQWAALRKTNVMFVQGLHLPGGYISSVFISVILGLLFYFSGTGLLHLFRRFR